MRKSLRSVLMPFAGIFLLTLALSTKVNAQGATVTTDQQDYAPGSTVYITGSGFEPGEAVTLQVKHDEADSMGTDPQYHQPWTVTADADGNISSSWIVPEDGDALGATFLLTADGQSSGLHAEWTFTDAPAISVSNNPACAGTSVTFNYTGGSVLPLTYQWTKNNIDIPSATSSTYTINSVAATDAGDYRLRVTALLSGGTSSPITLVVNPAPSVAAISGGATSVCVNSSTPAFTNSTGGGTWSITPGTGTASITQGGVVTGLTAGTVTVIYKVTSGGCSASATAALTVNGIPSSTPAIMGSASVCSIDNTLAYSVPAVFGASYTWAVPAGWTINSGQGTNSIAVTSGVTGQGGNITVAVSSTCGAGNGSLAVNFLDDIGYGGDPTANSATTCQGVAPGQQIIGGAAPNGPNYQWQVSINGGAFANISSGATAQNYTISSTYYNTAGTYKFHRVISSSTNACNGNSDDVTLIVNALPTVAALAGIQTVCVGSTTTFSSTTGGGVWGSDNTSVATVSGGVITGVSAGTANISYTVTNASGCSTSVVRSVTVTSTPTSVSALPVSATICAGDNLTLTGSSVIAPTVDILSDNFNGTGTLFTTAGTASNTFLGNSSIFAEKNSGFNVALVTTWNTPDASPFMLAYAADFGTSTSNSTLTTSPLINTTGYSTLALTFIHTYKKGDDFAAASVEVSTDPGNTVWTAVKTYNANQGVSGTNSDVATFVSDNVDLTPYINQPNFKFRFNYGATVSGANSWWAIDNVALSGTIVPLYSWTASPSGSGLTAAQQNPLNSNSSISVNPTTSTTYTLTAMNPVTLCTANSGNVVVTVNQKSSDPTAATASANPICSGESANLILHGVSAGTGEVIRWYTDAACTQLIPGQSGGGNGFTVSPTTTTTYWGRFEDPAPCSYNSPAQSVTVTVNTVPVITATDIGPVNNDLNICGASIMMGSNLAITGTDPITTYSLGDGTAISNPYTFSIGETMVYTKATNSCGTDEKTFNVTVVDNELPVAVAQDVTVILDANGNGSATAAAVDNGSHDACGIQSLSLFKTAFTCSDIATNPNQVILTVTDNNGNVSTATATVTVVDNTAPVAVAQDVTITLDANGNGSATGAAVDNGSHDACGIQSLSLSKTAFTCSDIATNPNQVTLTVTDNNGNVSTATATVTVVDNIKPTVVTQPATIYLDVNGAASVTAAQVNNGSSDNCSIASYSLDNTTFSCANVGPNTVTLTVTDVNGNSDSKTAVVTVEDKVKPIITAPVSVTVNTDKDLCSASGINLGTPVTSDNCGIGTVTNDAPAIFPKGATMVTWTVTDIHGNSNTAIQTVTVEDHQNPTIVNRPANQVISACQSTVTWAAPTFTDNCPGGSIVQTAGPASPATLANGETKTITYTATDASGNTSSCSFTITRNATLSATVTPNPLNQHLYYGFSGDQTVAINVAPTGGKAPYTVNIRLSRNLIANYVTAAGDETWTSTISSGGIKKDTNTVAGGTLLSGYTARTGGTGVGTGGYLQVSATLLDSATLTTTVIDADGCIYTRTDSIFAEDVRCFAGNSGNTKVQLCHQTGSAKNPCVSICVDASAVAEHLAHGDALGACPKVGCGVTYANQSPVSVAVTLDKLQAKIMPNPSVRGADFNLIVKGRKNEEIEIRVLNMLGQVVYNTKGAPNETYKFGSQFMSGVYLVEIRQGENVQVLKIIKQ